MALGFWFTFHSMLISHLINTYYSRLLKTSYKDYSIVLCLIFVVSLSSATLIYDHLLNQSAEGLE